MSQTEPKNDDQVVKVKLMGKSYYSLWISSVALLISLASFYTTYQHNKTMQLFNEVAYSPNLSYTIQHSEGKLSVINSGLGPAKIDSLKFFYNARFLSSNQDAWYDILVEKVNFDSLVEFKYQEDKMSVAAKYNAIGGVMQTNGRFTMFEILNLENRASVNRLMDDVLTNMDIHIYYSDLPTKTSKVVKLRHTLGKKPF